MILNSIGKYLTQLGALAFILTNINMVSSGLLVTQGHDWPSFLCLFITDLLASFLCFLSLFRGPFPFALKELL